MTNLEAQDIYLSYGENAVIDGVNFTIAEGRITALVGRNGCGKSTILRALARLLKPDKGSVYLSGESIFRLPTKEVAKQIAMLPQSAIAPEWSVFDLVAQGRYPHQSFFNQWSPEDERAVVSALDLTNLSNLADKPVDELSGGQRQRAWIAMALAQETPILLLDEPTTFLDMAHQAEVLDVLNQLNRDQGRTIVMVVHDLNQAARYADHVIAIKNGEVFSQGAPEDTISEQSVWDVFGARVQIIRDEFGGLIVVPKLAPRQRIDAPGKGSEERARENPV
jgi:iron complex transport system ATP-binding protein